MPAMILLLGATGIPAGEGSAGGADSAGAPAGELCRRDHGATSSFASILVEGMLKSRSGAT